MNSFRSGGSVELIGKLYKPYMHLVYGLCLKYLKDSDEAQDTVMEIFEILVEKLKTHEVEHFKSWLYMLSKNHCLMKLRSKKKITYIEDSEGEIMESGEYLHLDEEDFMEKQKSRLNGCLEQLKLEQKKCIELFYFDKKCYQEVTEITQYELKKVKSYIQNGKRNLKNCLEKVG